MTDRSLAPPTDTPPRDFSLPESLVAGSESILGELLLSTPRHSLELLEIF
jgi:hypothetical protein